MGCPRIVLCFLDADWIHRLTSIFEKRQAPQVKLDEVKTKLNILAAFVAKKFEQAKEAAEGAAQAIKDEL